MFALTLSHTVSSPVTKQILFSYLIEKKNENAHVIAYKFNILQTERKIKEKKGKKR